MKLKAVITIIYEYEPEKENYPPGSTIEDIIKIDKEGVEDDPELFLGSDNAEMEIKIEPITE